MRRLARLGVAAAALSAFGTTAGRSEDAPSAEALLERLDRAWQARDLEAYLSLWRFADAEARETEAEAARLHFGAEATLLSLQPMPTAARGSRLTVSARAFSINEPRARVEESLLTFEAGAAGWAVTERRPAGEIDGLVHLSLDPQGVRADGLTLRLEDFELQMREGTLFLPPPDVGPTLLVFVGDGTVRVSPKPVAEREELRKFCGGAELRERVRTAFIRIHPADLSSVLAPLRFTPDPRAAARLQRALKVFRAQANRAFVLDTNLPRSPWWLLPALGDASVSFETARRGTLTFTVSQSEFESISLFDRARRLQICLYPSQGGSTRYNEDDGRSVDVLDHDLRVRFQPDRFHVSGEDTLRLQLRSAASTLRLKLDEALRVESVTSRQGGNHLFFRVRGQDSLVISLGALGGAAGEVVLSVRYAGTLRPAAVEQELQGRDVVVTEEPVAIEDVLVYSNRLFWYPAAAGDDYALARLRFDLPLGYTALAGGSRISARVEAERTLVEYRQERPGKYISAAVGRFAPVGEMTAAGMALEAFGLSRTRDAAREVLGRAGEILDFFASEFGPPPYPALTLAVIEGVAPGGHSPPGMVILARRPLTLRERLRDDPANFDEVPDFFLAHELAHQWWGHGIAGKNYHERWLSEAFAQYAAALWVNHNRGEAAFRSLLRRMAEWALRRNDEGPISLGYRLGHVKGDSQTFRAVVYDKGALVLHMLRGIVGQEAFRRGLTALQARFRFQKAGSDELREALEAESGRPLSAYFDAWVFGTALPSLEVSRRHEPGGPPYRTHVSVRVQRLPGSVPLELGLAYRGGRETRTVELSPDGGAWTLETAGPPGKLEVNANQGLLTRISRK